MSFLKKIQDGRRFHGNWPSHDLENNIFLITLSQVTGRAKMVRLSQLTKKLNFNVFFTPTQP